MGCDVIWKKADEILGKIGYPLMGRGMMLTKNCAICGLPKQSYELLVEGNPRTRTEAIECTRCGRYRVNHETKPIIGELSDSDKIDLSGIVYETWRGYEAAGQSWEQVKILSAQDVQHLLKSPLIPKSVNEKAEKLLRYMVGISKFPGERRVLNPEDPCIQAVCYALNDREVGFYIDYLLDNGWISGERPDGVRGIARNVVITIPGYVKAEELERKRKSLSQGFVAMEFGVNRELKIDLEQLYDDFIHPAISGAGYSPIKIDRKDHNEKICDEIINEIRKSRFLVAEVTTRNPGVYYEAGFAKGWGMPVIYCCRKDRFKKVHFDVNHYNAIVWEEESELKKRLAGRVEATLGPGPGKQ